MIAKNPNMTNIFIIEEPTTFPIAISGFPRRAAITDVTISGALVPIATIVRPMIDSDTIKVRAMSTAPSTSIFHPKNNTAVPPITHATDLTGDCMISTSSLSSGTKF